MTSHHVRKMTPAGCERVAEIRVRGRQHACRGLIPQARSGRTAARRRFEAAGIAVPEVRYARALTG